MIGLNDILLLETAGICIYRHILRDRAVQSLFRLLKLLQEENSCMESIMESWSDIFAALMDNEAPSFYSHVMALTLHDENVFTLCCEKRKAGIEQPMAQQAASDLCVLQKLASIRCDNLKKRMKEKMRGNLEIYRLIDALPDWNSGEIPACPDMDLADRIRWHEKNGAGIFSNHVFFIWNGESFAPVANPDPVTLDNLYLLDSQKKIAVRNTEIFISGKAANNILFYGDRGTGKSSMVKALANAYSKNGLRLVEVPKKYLDQIPRMTSLLSGRGMKFILFIDDLAFDNNEEKYTALKAVLEGGLEHKPANILLYATSNRRHLVKEIFADRKGFCSDNPEEEIRARDSQQEKLSLADRFGITLVFSSPIKKEYLEIVHKIAEEEKLQFDRDLLEQKAMQWQMAYNGMSPRTARQFISWMKATEDAL